MVMGEDAIIRNHFFDLMASVVLPGPEDATQNDFPENDKSQNNDKSLKTTNRQIPEPDIF